jgi:hypothetical protein
MASSPATTSGQSAKAIVQPVAPSESLIVPA